MRRIITLAFTALLGLALPSLALAANPVTTTTNIRITASAGLTTPLNGSTYTSTQNIGFSSGHSYTLNNLNMFNRSLTYNTSYLLQAEITGTGNWATLDSGGAANITWNAGPMGTYSSIVTPLSKTWNGTAPANYSAKAYTKVEEVGGVAAEAQSVNNFTVIP